MHGIVLYTILNDNTRPASLAYKNAVGTDSGGNVKFYPSGEVPQGTKAPYSTFTLVSGNEDQNKSARGVYTRVVQVDHYSPRNAADKVTEMEEKCFAALNRFKGVVQDYKVQSIRGEGISGGFNQPQESTHRSQEFTIRVNP